jgi:outer membrane immunogenic protein
MRTCNGYWGSTTRKAEETQMQAGSLMVAAALLCVPAAALADGGPSPVPAYCCAQPTWSGVYAGVQAGGAWGDTGWTFPFVESFNTVPEQHFSTSPGGALVGGQLGVNQHIGGILLGGELAFVGTDWHETLTAPTTFPQERFKTVISNLLTVSGRGGIPFGNQLIYGKAGYANANVALGAFSGPPLPGVTANGSHREDGWTAGGGWEYRIGRSLVLGVEYDYVTLNGSRFTTTSGGAAPGLPFHVDLDTLTMHTLTARLSILLDVGPTAKAAK